MTETRKLNLVESENAHISMLEMMDAFSMALDLINPHLAGHHLKTCYVASRLARQLQLVEEDQIDIFAAAIMHDIGAIAMNNISRTLLFEEGNPHSHAELGFIMLEMFPPFKRFSELVRHHHVHWRYGVGNEHNGNPVSNLAHLVHLADRIAIRGHQAGGNYARIPEILTEIESLSGSHFIPRHVDAFSELAKQEAFWLDLYNERLSRVVMELSPAPEIQLDLDGMLDFARFYSRIIDTRSRFTSAHSSGVAASAAKTMELMGADTVTVTKMRIAGYLHDLGKLAVPREILEKPGKLDETEMRIIRSHTYHTRRILERISALSDVAEWAANHHEMPSGEGYPFRLQGNQLSRESRVLAVADVFTALREDRPYRKTMDRRATEKIMEEMVDKGQLDGEIVTIFKENFAAIDQAQIMAQCQEISDMTQFWDSIKLEANGPEAQGLMETRA